MAQRTDIEKYVLRYLAVLAGIFIVLSLFDINGDYVVERKLWKINRKYANVIKDYKTASVQVMDRVTAEYEKVIRDHGRSKAIPGVYIVLSRIYLLKGDLAKAREVSQELLKRYPDYRELCAEAVSLIAKSYEAENDWPKAYELYQKLVAEYPLTNVGVATPVYVANYYQGLNDFKNTMSSYAQAVEFYRKLIRENPDSRIEFESLRYLANCYVAQNRWDEAVQALKQVLLKYPSEKYLNAQRAELIITTINTIVATQIKDYGVAIAVYEEFIDKHPKHPLAKTLAALIVRFKELQDASSAGGGQAL